MGVKLTVEDKQKHSGGKDVRMQGWQWVGEWASGRVGDEAKWTHV